MTGGLDEYIAVSVVYFIMCGFVVTKGSRSFSNGVFLSVIFSIIYGFITFLYASALK